jgi:hypothetical protein
LLVGARDTGTKLVANAADLLRLLSSCGAAASLRLPLL